MSDILTSSRSSKGMTARDTGYVCVEGSKKRACALWTHFRLPLDTIHTTTTSPSISLFSLRQQATMQKIKNAIKGRRGDKDVDEYDVS